MTRFEGRALWNALQDALRGARADAIELRPTEGIQTAKLQLDSGVPTLIRPRLAKGAFASS